MKRIIAAIILSSLISLVLILGNVIIGNQCDVLMENVNQLKSDIFSNKTESVNEQVEKINVLWKKAETIMAIFSNHTPLDDITIALNELTVAVEASDKNISLVKCGEISALLGRITDEQRISTESFF